MVSELVLVMLIALLAGLAMPAGALLGFLQEIQPRWIEEETRHGILALGAGALLSAVALVLVPHGMNHLSIGIAVSCFLAGAVAFMALDVWLAKHNTKGSMLSAMLADFLPESIALGAIATLGGNIVLLGVLIAIQNLPEGFNAYRELEANKHHSRKANVWLFTLMALLGPLCAAIGFFWLSDEPILLSGIMMFAAGGILYSVLQDIAPQIRMESHWLPPMGGILGFLIGIIGVMLE